MNGIYTIAQIINLERKRIQGTHERLISVDTVRKYARDHLDLTGVQYLYTREDYENFKKRDTVPGRKRKCQ